MGSVTGMGHRVLVVDDDPTVSDVVRRYLEQDGCQVRLAADGADGLAAVAEQRPDLVVLDLMMPGIDGLEVCRRLRHRLPDLPVIMLTALGEEADRVLGLEVGADDYVTKPFSPRELTARVRTVLRRARDTAPIAARLVFDNLELDAAAREVRRDGEDVRLTAREFELLWFLASNPRQVFSRDQLMARVWGYTSALDTGTVTVHMRRLRAKLEPDPVRPRYLETVWGSGYRFVP